MKVSFLDLKRQYAEIQEEVEEKAIEVLRSGSYVMGSYVKEFEEQMAEYLGVKHVVTVANGTEALVIALKAAGVVPGDEVITTTFTFFATAEAIATIGAIPVFVDIEDDSFNIDPKNIEEKITDKTKAIMIVHIFGKCADMDEINKIAKKANLKVIEDAAQAIGAEYKGRKAGTLGDLACFSFYPTKNLGCAGDGGMITTNDDDLYKICSAYKNHGAGKIGSEARELLTNKKEEIKEQEGQTELYDPYKYYNYLIGHNSRLDAIQAAILSIKLRKLDTYNANREKIAKRYVEEFSKNNIRTSTPDPIGINCWHQFAVRTDKKEEMIKFLTESGIGCSNFYPVPLHLQKAFDYLKYEEGSLPVAEKLCSETVCLPIFPELTDEEVDAVIAKVIEFQGEK